MTKTFKTPWLRYLYYRKAGLIENEIVNSHKVTLQLKDGKTVIIEISEADKRKILLT